MRSITTSLITAVALLSLAACAGNRPLPETDTESQAVTSTESVSEETLPLEAVEEVTESQTETDASAEHGQDEAAESEETAATE